MEEQEEQDRPEWLIYENVKGMLSSNKGLDYLSILSEMDRLGYDCEWQNINSKLFVPQNRERIYTIWHLRRYGRRKVLPVTGADGENSVCQIGKQKSHRNNPNQNTVYGQNEKVPCLNTMEDRGREPHVALPCFCDMNYGAGIKLTENARTLQARYNKGINNHAAETSGVAIKIIGKVNSSQDGQIHSINGIAKCHSAGHNNSPKVAIPVRTPDRAEKRQNGRRFKENGEPMFTLTAQDRHGVAIGVEMKGILRTVRSEFGKKIRNDYESGKVKISRHKFLEYDIKTDGCSNTIDSVQKDNLLALKCNISEIHGNGIYVEMPEGFMVYAIWYEKEQCYIAIRRLTPKECFRLQGWSDDYYEKAAFVNYDSRLYMQAGNGVTVDVVYEIGKRINDSMNIS